MVPRPAGNHLRRCGQVREGRVRSGGFRVRDGGHVPASARRRLCGERRRPFRNRPERLSLGRACDDRPQNCLDRRAKRRLCSRLRRHRARGRRRRAPRSAPPGDPRGRAAYRDRAGVRVPLERRRLRLGSQAAIHAAQAAQGGQGGGVRAGAVQLLQYAALAAGGRRHLLQKAVPAAGDVRIERPSAAAVAQSGVIPALSTGAPAGAMARAAFRDEPPPGGSPRQPTGEWCRAAGPSTAGGCAPGIRR